jgi:hypothetical protein
VTHYRCSKKCCQDRCRLFFMAGVFTLENALKYNNHKSLKIKRSAHFLH